ncbi:hypothetical protein [Candidatus Avelusimicrobium fimicolum]|uniref:hypothetical protein n=1 Tax=Candidatus Avelusimicrobium fimicolum TaxID=3416216 RepID=UPI003D0E1B91
MTKGDIIKNIQSIGGIVTGEVEICGTPCNKGITIATHSSHSVKYKDKDHELVIYEDENGNVHKTNITGPFSQEIKQEAKLS